MRDRIQSRLENGIAERVFPGAVVGVVDEKGLQTIIPMGKFTYEETAEPVAEATVYDTASITKSIPTACLALALVEEGKLDLNAPFSKYVPEYNNSYRETLLIRHLLTYSAKLDLPVPGFSYKGANLQDMWKVFLSRELRHPPGTTFEYSNPPSILLTKAIENIIGRTLDVLADQYFFAPLGMQATTFHPSEPLAIPPTEIDDWRGLVQGVVHDETAYILSKDRVTGCAGIFSNVSDILIFVSMLLNNGELNGRRYFSQEMVNQMYTNQLAAIGASMGLGWELNVPRFMGTYSHGSMFGKTGFTGTVIVADPIKRLGYVMLSNRTYPKRSNADAINSVRRDISDIVFGTEV